MHRCIATIVALVSLVCACERRPGQRGSGPNAMTVNSLGAKLNLSFPEDARLLGVREMSGFDDALFAKVEFTSDRYDSFLASSPFGAADFAEERRYLLGESDTFWDPKSPSQLPTAQTRLPNGRVLNMGIDRSEPNKVVIYLMWHGT